ncbi:hypothetical protein XBKQ1_1280043 [Xenorhabdus bovienii str. kraussei Quebec]|uniref:Uncharacterized protein n=1 Tax=Xenorhabdus bovienii str. kraussei Quebec TaxID=1398203 RepID=A0A077PCU4_XENBV|nr:hypothetical protein XBKQ1_1280043 [Xenorhabdus bovienii str. kraussei Quebec]
MISATYHAIFDYVAQLGYDITINQTEVSTWPQMLLFVLV